MTIFKNFMKQIFLNQNREPENYFPQTQELYHNNAFPGQAVLKFTYCCCGQKHGLWSQTPPGFKLHHCHFLKALGKRYDDLGAPFPHL